MRTPNQPLISILFALVIVTFLKACAGTPQQYAAATSMLLVKASNEIERLETLGRIQDPLEDEIQAKISFAHSLLLDYGAPLVSRELCPEASTRIDCAVSVLDQADAILCGLGETEFCEVEQ